MGKQGKALLAQRIYLALAPGGRLVSGRAFVGVVAVESLAGAHYLTITIILITNTTTIISISSSTIAIISITITATIICNTTTTITHYIY